MKKEIQKECMNLWDLMQQELELKKQINIKLDNYSEANRKFSNGETIIIYSTITNKEVGRGIVASVCTHIHLDPLWLKGYSDFDYMDKDFELRYEIYAIKKDGTQSTKHFFHSPHFISENQNKGEWYITKII